MMVLGVPSGGSHAAAHISPFVSNITSLSLTGTRFIDVADGVDGVEGGGGGGAPRWATDVGAAYASSVPSELSELSPDLTLVASSGSCPASIPACASIVSSTTSAGTLTYNVGRRPGMVLESSA